MKLKKFRIDVRNTAHHWFTAKAASRENALRNARKMVPPDWGVGCNEFTVEEVKDEQK